MVELSFDHDIAWSGNVLDKENKSHTYAMEEGMIITNVYVESKSFLASTF